jgi:thermitase
VTSVVLALCGGPAYAHSLAAPPGTGAHSLAAPPGTGHPARYRPGVVLIGFRPGVSPLQRLRIEQGVGARPGRPLAALDTATSAERALTHRIGPSFLLHVARGRVLAAVDSLRRESRWVRYAEPDYILAASGQSPGTVPDDSFFDLQWGSLNTGQNVNGVSGTPGADDRATEAWNVTTGSRAIVIGEPDTGVDYTHPDLAPNIWSNPGGIGNCPAGTHGFDVVDSTTPCDPMDEDTDYNGHGTHVAGIMGAVGNNATGVAGMNWRTTILPVKWLSTENATGTTDQLISALNLLLAAKQAGVNIRVVNDSSVYYGTAYSQALSDEIDELGANGILFVTAAGNSGEDMDANSAYVRYPCAYDRPTEICVTASDQNDALPSWANYSPNLVDLAAPGDNIYSTLRNGGYGYISGGSMAAAQVSGAAALILSARDMSPTALKADILDNVDQLPALSGKVRTGGRLDVCAAMPGCGSPIPDETAVSCSPDSVEVGGSSTCTVTVSDTLSGTSVSPTGATVLSSDSAPASAFSPSASCTLAPGPGPGEASCSVSYTPPGPGSDTHRITANYAGDSAHTGSTGSTSLSVIWPAEVTVGASPASLVADGSSTAQLTASVSDQHGNPLSGEPVVFSSSDSAVKIGPVSAHSDGSYTATLTSSTTPHTVTITATDGSLSAQTELTQTQPPRQPTSLSSSRTGTTPTPANGAPAAPVNAAPPRILGIALPGRRLVCWPGAWVGAVTLSYAWTLNGHRILGADRPRYDVQIFDEAARIGCTVRARNSAGTALATAPGNGQLVGLATAAACPRPRGQLKGRQLGALAIGMSRSAARRRLPLSRGARRSGDFFCLYAGWGIEVGYLPRAPLGRPTTRRSARRGAYIAIMITANPHYAALGLRPGARVSATRIRLGRGIRIGSRLWYVRSSRTANVVIAVHDGVVDAIGLADRALSQRAAARLLEGLGVRLIASA